LADFLANPSIEVSGQTYAAFLSDELKEKLNNEATKGHFSQKLDARLQEIRGRDWKACPFKLVGFNLYSSDDGDVYSAASMDNDW
jgi:hypothetical protein